MMKIGLKEGTRFFSPVSSLGHVLRAESRFINLFSDLLGDLCPDGRPPCCSVSPSVMRPSVYWLLDLLHVLLSLFQQLTLAAFRNEEVVHADGDTRLVRAHRRTQGGRKRFGPTARSPSGRKTTGSNCR